ncbi:Oxidoreductase htatip2 [Parelaphostrongylus tenuis]|uniref:Oxidoreductase htatip2 n=1 Tax=Parelaphostrongylus tenuis TaxID=148309 RepID=A0AAD5QYH6_PARTN|nr:Oxidoreductase htatip2 [Parelaphostrongylus tenuis]
MLRSAFVVGALGAVGKHLIEAFVASHQFKEIRVIGRREIPLNHESIIGVPLHQVIVNFDALEKHEEVFKGLDIGFCALGTTRAKAGKDVCYKVDHDYVVNVAKIAKVQGYGHPKLFY